MGINGYGLGLANERLKRPRHLLIRPVGAHEGLVGWLSDATKPQLHWNCRRRRRHGARCVWSYGRRRGHRHVSELVVHRLGRSQLLDERRVPIGCLLELRNERRVLHLERVDLGGLAWP
jgi:hypothetical protein